jgi:hypothetical protein
VWWAQVCGWRKENVLNRPMETNWDKRNLRDRVGNTRNDNIGRLIVVDRPRARAYSKRLDAAEEDFASCSGGLGTLRWSRQRMEDR